MSKYSKTKRWAVANYKGMRTEGAQFLQKGEHGVFLLENISSVANSGAI